MIEEIIRRASELVTPTSEEERSVNLITNRVVEVLDKWVKSAGVNATVEVLGSSARSTWLPGQRDIDVFVIMERGEDIRKVVESLSNFLTEVGISWFVRYAQHPYVTLSIDNYEVDVVPCYRINPGEKPITAADRSPLHHRFLSERLTQTQRGDVRLLKQFLKTIGVYGAEIEVEGFSGYLTELLVLYYGSFVEVLKAVEKWRPYKTYITFFDTQKKFKAPLVVIDPVDPHRNAAAAVSLTSMSTFILAAKRFLKKPSLTYFTPGEVNVVLTNVVEIVFPHPQQPPEVVWGKYKRLGKTLYNWITECGFRVFRWGVESDEKSYVKLIYVLDQLSLGHYQLHKGPPVYDDSVHAFVEKYLESEVVGPFVHGSRVYVIKKRRFTEISQCITSRLGGGNYTIHINKYRGRLVSRNPWIT